MSQLAPDGPRPVIRDIYNIQTTNKLRINVYNVFYSQYPHQHVSAAIGVILRVILVLSLLLLLLLLLQHNGIDVVSCVVYRLEQFQPFYNTVHTSPKTRTNRYTTTSTHHLQPDPTGIPHRPHITYNQFQPVYHTVHTSPTTSSNRYTTTSTHHLLAALKLTTSLNQASLCTD